MLLKIFAFILCSNLLFSCSGHTTKLPNSSVVKENGDLQDSVKQKAEQLKSIYPRLSSSYQGMYDYEYFEAFPKSFKTLNALFGYTDKEPMGTEFNPGPLYDEAHLYMEAFFKLNIGKKEYYKRMIEISLNGRWYADGVNYFRHGMKEKVKQDLEIFCELLSGYSDKEIQGFWYFYFDGPHPADAIPEELQKAELINERIYRLMETGLKEVQQSWKE